MKVAEAASSSAWLPDRSDEFWIRLQVYPEAIAHSETGDEYERKTRGVVNSIGSGNLQYLCGQAGINFRPNLDASDQLASRLLSSTSRKELIYLATFLRARKTAVVEYFDAATSEGDKAGLAAEIVTANPRRAETAKPFTKLVWLYRSNPECLEMIHYRHAWRRLPTVASFFAPTGLPSNAVSLLVGNMTEFVSKLNAIKPGETYEEFGTATLAGRTTVFVVHRCFPPSVRSDYQQKFRLQHDFSIITFAMDMATSTLLIKVANRAISECVQHWVAETLHVELSSSGSNLFSAYSAESVEHSLLGGYDEMCGIDLIGIAFCHSFGPNHSPISLKAGEFSRGIREDLAWLKQANVIRLRSLSEIQTLQVRFEGHEIEINGEVETGGAFRLRVVDSGLTEDTTDRLREAFQRAFQIPLDQGIDPTILTMGPSQIYQFLLSGVLEDQVHPYQKASLAKLIQWGLLKPVEGKTGCCTEVSCSSRSQTVTDVALTECPTCQTRLIWKDFCRYDEDKKAQLRIVRELLHKSTNWKLGSSPLSFESQKFHRLSSSKMPGQTICVFLNDRTSTAKMEIFHRAMFPIVIIHPLGQQTLPVIDPTGIAHVGLPYLLAAHEVKDDWKKLREGFKDVFGRLLRLEKERVLRTSRASHEHLCQKPPLYHDRNYETDVFNILRSLFPFTVKWGGGNKPDGFSSLAYFPGNDLRKPKYFNWSYDAKFSDSTYPFEIGEFRQIFDYVRRLHAPKRLQSLGNSYDAHAIITNSMQDSAMKNAASFMKTQHKLGSGLPDFLLVFVRDSFLTVLWNRVRDAETEFYKRGTYLEEYFVAAITGGLTDDYCLLDGDSANSLADRVLSEPPIKDPIDANKLKKDLKDQIVKRSSKRPSLKAAGK